MAAWGDRPSYSSSPSGNTGGFWGGSSSSSRSSSSSSSGSSVNLGSSAGVFLGNNPANIQGNPSPRSPTTYSNVPEASEVVGQSLGTGTSGLSSSPANLGSSAGMFLGFDAANIQGNPSPRAPTVNSPPPANGTSAPVGRDVALPPTSSGLFPGLFTGAAIDNPNLIESAVNEALNFGPPTGDSLGMAGKLLGLVPGLGTLATIGGIMGDLGGENDPIPGANIADQPIGVNQPIETPREGRNIVPLRPRGPTVGSEPLQQSLGQPGINTGTGSGQVPFARLGQAYGTGGGFL